jgi:hypothetical protein
MGAALLRLYFVAAIVGFVLAVTDVVSLTAWLVGVSVAPAGAVVVIAIADAVPSRIGREIGSGEMDRSLKADKESPVVEPAGAGPAVRHDQGGRWRRLLLLAVLLLVAASDGYDDWPGLTIATAAALSPHRRLVLAALIRSRGAASLRAHVRPLHEHARSNAPGRERSQRMT